MVSQDKLIQNGIKYTDALFDEINKRLEQGIRNSDTLESFLDKYHKAFPDKDNPLISLGYDKQMLSIILQETNNHKFSRPSQKEMVRVTIENKVGDLIVDVGDDIRESVRDIVKDGYNNNLSQDEIADNITSKVDAIKGRRALAIARTEVARASTVSDYIINAEMGATHFYVECRNTACPICKKNWHKKWTIENDESFTPKEYTAGKKGWVGDKVFSMGDTSMLPPVHPNCRCVPYFITKDGAAPKPKPKQVQEPTPEQLKKKLTPAERAKYVNYKRVIESHTKWLKDNPNAPVKQINGHKQRLAKAQKSLDELRVKALGGATGSTSNSKPTPKPELKPKPKSEPKPQKPKTEPKPKVTPKPKPKAKPKEPTQPPKTETKTPTREQKDKNLTQKERKEYNDLQYELNWANNIIKNPNSNPKQINYAKSRIAEKTPRFQQLTNKALGIKTKTKRKTSKKTTTKSKKKEQKVVEINKPKNARLTKEECNSLTFEQLADHHNVTYKGLVKIASDNNKEYHVFEQKFSNGETFTLHFEKSAVNSYKREGISTANEIIHEVFKVPEILRNETNEIWFRNSQKGVAKNKKGTGFKSFAKDEGGMNVSTNKKYYKLMKSMGEKVIDDPNHQIGINPKYFKKLKDFFDILNWRDRPEEKVSWKHAIHHEFMHSIDTSREIWNNDLSRLSDTQEYKTIHNEEKYFTAYANGLRSESFAEHGGFISYMLANPNDQTKLLKIQVPKKDENGRTRIVEEQINFEEYKERYPLHYEYFIKLLKG